MKDTKAHETAQPPSVWDAANAPLCLAIGRFVMAFSHLEFSLRVALALALRLSNKQFDAVTATYDFSALCHVTKAVSLDRHRSDALRCRKIEKVINRCLDLHEKVRNPIVHATWSGTESGRISRHVVRRSHKVTSPFTTPEQIAAKTAEVDRTRADVFAVFSGPAAP